MLISHLTFDSEGFQEVLTSSIMQAISQKPQLTWTLKCNEVTDEVTGEERPTVFVLTSGACRLLLLLCCVRTCVLRSFCALAGCVFVSVPKRVTRRNLDMQASGAAVELDIEIVSY